MPLIGAIGNVPSTLRPPSGDWIPSWRSPAFTGELSHQLDPGAPAGLVENVVSPGVPQSFQRTTDLAVRPAPVAEAEPGPGPGPGPGQSPLARVFQSIRHAFGGDSTRAAASASGAPARGVLASGSGVPALGSGAPTSGTGSESGARRNLSPDPDNFLPSSGTSSPAVASSGTASLAGGTDPTAGLLGSLPPFASLPTATASAPGNTQVIAPSPSAARRALSVVSAATGPAVATAAPLADSLELSHPTLTSDIGATAPVESAEATPQSAGPATSAGRAIPPAALSRRRAGLGAPITPEAAQALATNASTPATRGLLGSNTDTPSLGADATIGALAEPASLGGATPTATLGAVAAPSAGAPAAAAAGPTAGAGTGARAGAGAAVDSAAGGGSTGQGIGAAVDSATGGSGATTGAGGAGAGGGGERGLLSSSTVGALIDNADSALGGALGTAGGLGGSGPVGSVRASLGAGSDLAAGLDASSAGATNASSAGANAGAGGSRSDGSGLSAGAGGAAVASGNGLESGGAAPVGSSLAAALGRRVLGVSASAGVLGHSTSAGVLGQSTSAGVLGAATSAGGSSTAGGGLGSAGGLAGAGGDMAVVGARASGGESGEPVVAGGFDELLGSQSATVPLLGERALSPEVGELLPNAPSGQAITSAQPVVYAPNQPDTSAGATLTPPGTTPPRAAPGSGRPAVSRPASAAAPVVPATFGGDAVEGNVVESVSAPASGSTSVAIPQESSVPEGAPSVSPAVPGRSAGSESMSAADVDGLARRLYEPIARRLRAELWVDRERTGTLMDRMW